MKTFEIKKRNSEEVACWVIDANGVCPNTVIDNSERVTLIVKVDGVSKITAASSFTTNGLYNPGKNTKLFGGMKPYENIEMIAIDQSSEFFAEWGIAGPDALPFYDVDNGVDCKAIAFGKYYYKVVDFHAFVSTFSFDAKGEISRSNVREYLRTETAGIIKSYLASAIANKDMRVCQSEIAEYCTDIKESINKHLVSKGIEIYNFTFSKLSYDLEHERKRSAIDNARMDVNINKVMNEGKKDDIGVEDAAADVQVKLIDAVGRANGHGAEKINAEAKNGATAAFCPRCGTKNENARFCKSCGEKLPNV